MFFDGQNIDGDLRVCDNIGILFNPFSFASFELYIIIFISQDRFFHVLLFLIFNFAF